MKYKVFIEYDCERNRYLARANDIYEETPWSDVGDTKVEAINAALKSIKEWKEKCK